MLEMLRYVTEKGGGNCWCELLFWNVDLYPMLNYDPLKQLLDLPTAYHPNRLGNTIRGRS